MVIFKLVNLSGRSRCFRELPGSMQELQEIARTEFGIGNYVFEIFQSKQKNILKSYQELENYFNKAKKEKQRKFLVKVLRSRNIDRKKITGINFADLSNIQNKKKLQQKPQKESINKIQKLPKFKTRLRNKTSQTDNKILINEQRAKNTAKQLSLTPPDLSTISKDKQQQEQNIGNNKPIINMSDYNQTPILTPIIPVQPQIIQPSIPQQSYSTFLSMEVLQNQQGFSGDIYPPDTTITKSWLLRNNGQTTWPPGCYFYSQTFLQFQTCPLPAVSPSDQVSVQLKIKSPQFQSLQFTSWTLFSPQNLPIGLPLEFNFQVSHPSQRRFSQAKRALIEMGFSPSLSQQALQKYHENFPVILDKLTSGFQQKMSEELDLLRAMFGDELEEQENKVSLTIKPSTDEFTMEFVQFKLESRTATRFG